MNQDSFPSDPDGNDTVYGIWFDSSGEGGPKTQWLRVDGSTETVIDGATHSRYNLTAADVGKQLKLRMSLEDDRGNVETVTSAEFPAMGTIKDTALCPAPTLVGGATEIWTSTASLDYFILLRSKASGFSTNSEAGELDDNNLSVGSNEYEISFFYDRLDQDNNRQIRFGLNSQIATSEVDRLTLYVCNGGLRFADTTRSGDTILSGFYTYVWDNSAGTVDMFEHGVRQVYISRDAVAPTVASATVDGTKLTIAFSEDLAAAFSLVNSAFTVKRTPSGGTEGPVALTGTPSISGRTVTLTLSAALAATDTGIKVSYTKPTTGSNNKLADRFTNQVANFTDQAVRFNAAATGKPAITVPNVYRVPAALTATKGNITDPGGLPPESDFTWQWVRVDGTTDRDIPGATGRTYTLTDADAGKRIKVKAGLTDSSGDSEGPFTSAATSAVVSRAACDAPAYSGGAQQIWTGTVGVGESPLVATTHGYVSSPAFGTLSAPALTLGGTEYTITTAYAASGERQFEFYSSAAIPAAERNRLILYVCDEALQFKDAETSGGDDYLWDPSTLDWSAHAERTLYLARDAVAPRVVWARVSGTKLTINFSEDLGAAASLANTAFTVKKTPSGGTESTVALSTADAPSISGSQVTLTLATAPAATDDGINVSYTRPTTAGANKELVDKFGNLVANFTRQAVGRENAAAAGTPAITVPNAYRVPAVLTATKGTLADGNGLPAESGMMWQWIRVDGANETDISGATGSTYTLTDADADKTIKVKVNFIDLHGYKEGPFTSSAVPGSGTVLARAACKAPTYSGGATRIWTDTVTVQKAGDNVGFYTTGPVGAISDNKFSVGTTEYTITSTYVYQTEKFIFRTTPNLPEATRQQLALHVCDADLPFHSGTFITDRMEWSSLSGVTGWAGWSDQAVRTLYISRDAVAPTVVEAEVDGEELVITFSEDLAAASSLANGAFVVEKTPDGGTEKTVTLTGSPGISGSKVTLTLSAELEDTDTNIKVSYKKPTTGSNNKLADKFGNQVANFTDQPVTILQPYPPVTVKFEKGSYSVNEDDSVSVTVIMSANHERPGGLVIPFTVAGLGGAVGGTDYLAPGGVWFRYEQTRMTFDIQGLHDLIDDDNEGVRLGFGDLPRGVTAVSPTAATINIIDDEGPMDAAYGLSQPAAYWQNSWSNSLTLDRCTGTRSVRMDWDHPDGKGAADEWEVYVTSRGGLSLSNHSFKNRSGWSEMNGTVRMRGKGSLSINVRGRWDTTWGTWSRAASLYCSENGN